MAASHADGVLLSAVNETAVTSLYARGLVWFNIPVDAGDHVSIPPLEGFVSNKTASVSIDPLETLLYQIFVAASESVTVSELADILDTSVENVKVGISMACRLGFCNKLDAGAGAGARAPVEAQIDTPSAGSTRVIATPQRDSLANGTHSSQQKEQQEHHQPAAKEKKSIAFVVDSAITGFLMMGALTPDVKKHSVTLFEGGRVYGAGVIDELVRGLEASVDMSKDFEGEMLELGRTSRSMAAVLRCLLSTAASSTELLRKESFEQLADKEQAERILVRSHDVLICAAGLKGPALPIKDAANSSGPTLFGPSPLCLTPWINVALYKRSGSGPRSIVLPAGSMLETDELFHGAPKVLVWKWTDAHEPQTLNARVALFEINTMLQTSAVMIQPVPCTDVEKPVFVPLPFVRNPDGSVDAFTSIDGDRIPIEVEARVESALESMGLLRNVGTVSFLPPGTTGQPWVPLGIAIGFPLTPVGLCEHLCSRLATTAFLSPESLARQREYQIMLEKAVTEAKGTDGDHATWPTATAVLVNP